MTIELIPSMERCHLSTSQIAMVAPRAWFTDYQIVGLKQKVRKIIDTTVAKSVSVNLSKAINEIHTAEIFADKAGISQKTMQDALTDDAKGTPE